MMPVHLKEFLDNKVKEYNRPEFIEDDPISVPHLFSKKQDVEIAGFFASIFAWGNRTTIINKSKELLEKLEHAPHDFIISHTAKDLQKLKGFKHRTFNEDDLFYFIESLHQHYVKYDSLEMAFFPNRDHNAEQGLIRFKNYFFSSDHLKRTEKHISSPLQKS